MKNFFDKDLLIVLSPYILFFLIIFGIGGVRAVMTQNALNEQCGTKYNIVQVAIAGDNLSRICQSKQGISK